MLFDKSLLLLAINQIDLEKTDEKHIRFYHDLQEKMYTIVFHFDVHEDCLYYEAFAKTDAQLHTNIDYVVLRLPFFNTKIWTVTDALNDLNTLMLGYYIFQVDESKAVDDPSYYDRKYHFIPENLRHFSSMNDEKRQDFIDAREQFINILNYIERVNVINDSQKEDQLATEFAKIHKDIFAQIDKDKYEFDASFEQKMLTRHVQFYENDDLYEQLAKIGQIGGQKLVVNNVEYRINSETINGSINIDEFNKLVFSPTLRFLDQKRYFYDTKRSFIEVNIIRKTIRLITFPTITAAVFYAYFVDNPIVKIDYIKDLLEAKLGEDFTKIFIPKKTQDIPSHFLHIDYHVNLKITNSLEFSTVYRLNNKIFSREDLVKNYYYKNVVTEFESIVRSLGLPINSLHSNINVLDFLTLDLEPLKEIAHVILDESIYDKKITTRPDIQFSAKKNNDWFEVDIISKTYTQEQIEKIFSSLKEKRNYVVINEDVIDLNHLENKKDLIDVYNFKNRFQKQFPMYELFRLESLRQHTNIEITYDDYVKKVLYEIKNYKDVEVELPEHFKESLRDYQVEAVKWMSVLSRNGLAGILADDMGLGKTLETIAYLETLKEDEPVLIVCPKSVTYNWLYEFEKRESSYKCTVIEGSKEIRDQIVNDIGKNKREVFITSYDTLRNDIDSIKDHFFNIVILDESQYIKNAGALKSKAVKQLECRYRFSLTGTPVENGLSDLWSIFDFIMPGYLLTYNEFRQEYEFAFEEGSENEEIKNKLIAKITPFVFKRTKEEVLKDLPQKTTTTVTIAMTEQQQDIYSTYLRKTKLMFKNIETTTRFRILQGILRLRQICVDPSAFLLNYDEIPSKISFSLEMIDEVMKKEDSKIIVYSSFVTVLDHLATCLKQEGIKVLKIDGSTNAHDRVKYADRFNLEPEYKIILVSIKAGGTGLNLVGADTVIILDPWWNAAVEEQAADRAHRIGQTRSVNVYKLISHNSIEEKIIKLQNKKQDLYEKLIREDTDGITGLSDEDLNYIFS